MEEIKIVNCVECGELLFDGFTLRKAFITWESLPYSTENANKGELGALCIPCDEILGILLELDREKMW